MVVLFIIFKFARNIIKKEEMKENGIKIPDKIEDIMLVQPNNLTFGQYDISERQENILTLIVDALQNHISTSAALPRDLMNEPYV